MSNTDTVIRADAIGKKYVIAHAAEGPARTLRDTISDAARGWGRRLTGGTREPDRTREEFWALKDVSFEVKRGEVVGVIGRNGAGKSTLLKVLSRITEPTTGRIEIDGRVASLLEVGTGFHPELTGRENVYMNGAILGMGRHEIRRKFDEIVAFAEVEKFIDTPVKRYSSGMYVRLAFAVAAHLEPEILIVDEVLAVGDAEFQRKCLGKLRSVSSQEGRSVIFVSHDMGAINNLTQRAAILARGRIEYFGPTPEAARLYLAGSGPIRSEFVAPRPVEDRPYLAGVRVNTSISPGIQATGAGMAVELRLSHSCPVKGACVSFQIINQFGQPATHLWLYHNDHCFAGQEGQTTLVCDMPRVRLNVGRYSLKVYFSGPPGGLVFDSVEDVCPFEVVHLGRPVLWGARPEVCVYHEEGNWSVHAE